jgi:outer membrane murein-binding lipoprotein Lpp
MKNLTKILVLALVLVSIGIAGCQKEIGKVDELRSKAEEISRLHNQLLSQILEKNENKKMKRQNYINKIMEITGVKIKKINKLKNYTQNGSCVINLNKDFRMSYYVQEDKNFKKIINKFDDIINNDTLELNKKVEKITEIENEIEKMNLDLDTKKKVLNNAEILKGSINFWTNEKLKLKEAKSPWLKIGIIAGCDALGALIGSKREVVISSSEGTYDVQSGENIAAVAAAYSALAALAIM